MARRGTGLLDRRRGDQPGRGGDGLEAAGPAHHVRLSSYDRDQRRFADLALDGLFSGLGRWLPEIVAADRACVEHSVEHFGVRSQLSAVALLGVLLVSRLPGASLRIAARRKQRWPSQAQRNHNHVATKVHMPRCIG